MSTYRSLVGPLAVLSIAPAMATAQAPAPTDPSPRTTVFVAAGAGQADASDAPVDYDAILGVVGVRRRVWRALTAEGAVQVQQPFISAYDVSLVCQPVPGDDEHCRITQRATHARNTRALASALARVGVEERLGASGPFVRVAAGGGYMTRVREPLASLAGGIAFDARRVRVALDIDRWWSRVDVTEVTLSMRDPSARSERPFRVATTSTFVRLGLELPVGPR